jgi:oxepin-CoA hydrolase/3-oxo-5,6-dehydrosuberyl-CoA semialdehyde dehydrogenase
LEILGNSRKNSYRSRYCQFSNVSWDHFYAHTDATSLTELFSIKQLLTDILSFQQRQDYLFQVKKDLLSQITDWKTAFFKPVYAGDTITVYLTAKEKINRGVKGRNIPSGVVKWLVEVVNQRDEVVCVATILTLVAKNLLSLI